MVILVRSAQIHLLFTIGTVDYTRKKIDFLTICNGKREVWEDYEEAKAYFLELMILPRARNGIERSVFIFSSCMDWKNVWTRMKNKKTGRFR